MAGRANGRGSKSSSTSKSVRDRIKDAREMGISGIKSKKKDTATSGTKRNYGGAKPRRVGQGGTTTITESVDNLVGGAFTKKGKGARRIDPEKRAELIAKRGERKSLSPEQREIAEARRAKTLERLKEARKRTKENEAKSETRERPGGGGIKGRGPKRPGRGVTDTTPADRGRGPRAGGNQIDNRGPKRAPRGPGQTGGNVGSGGRGSKPGAGRGPKSTPNDIGQNGGNVGPGGSGPNRIPGSPGPKAGIGRGGKSGVGRGPKAGGNQIGNRGGGAKPGRGQGPKRSPGQTGGNVGPGGRGPNRTGDFGTVYFM